MHNKYVHYDCLTTDKATFIVNVTSKTEQVVKPQPHESWFLLRRGAGDITERTRVSLNSSQNEICEHVYILILHGH